MSTEPSIKGKAPKYMVKVKGCSVIVAKIRKAKSTVLFLFSIFVLSGKGRC